MALTQTEKDALLELKAKGHSFEEAMSFIGGQRLGGSSKIATQYGGSTITPTPSSASEPGLQDRLANVGNTASKDIVDAIAGRGEFTNQSPVRRGVEAVATASSVVPKAAVELAPEPVRTGIEKLGNFIGDNFKKLTDKIADTELFKGAAGNLIVSKDGTVSYQPNDLSTIEDTLGTVAAGGEIAGNILAVEGGVKTLTKGADVTKKISSNVGEFASTKMNDAVKELQGIELPSIDGINLAKQSGFAPEDIMQRVARVSKGKQTKFEERAGESIGSYLVSRDIFGTPDQIVDQLYARMKDSKSRVDASIAQVKGEFKAPAVKTALDDLLERDTRVSTEGALSPDSTRIEQLYKKYNQQGLTLSEVNEVKRLYERNVKVDYLSFGNPQADKLARANNIDTALRNLVEDKASKSGITTVKELNKETSLAKQLLDDLGAEYAGQAGNNAIGLSDTIFLAESLGNPIAAAGFIAKKTLGSKKAMSAVAKLLSKDAGSKAELPVVPAEDPNKLSGYLEFLSKQGSNSSGQ